MKRAGDVDADFKLRVLKSTTLFSRSADDDLEELARVAKPVAGARGKPLAKPGAEGAQIFAIQTGVAGDLLADSSGGDALLVGMHGAGDTAGVVCAVTHLNAVNDSEPDRRQLHCLSNVTALALPAPDFFRICRRSTELSLSLAETLAREANDMARLFAKAVAASLEAKLSAFFSRLAFLTSTEDWNPATNVGPISQSTVAQMLGVSREHVNRTLAMWERSGLIFQNKSGEVIVQNRTRLAALSADRPKSSGEKGDEWLWEIDAHLDHGLNQAAQHLALEAAKRAPKELRYAHRAVLAAARAGAYGEALALFFKLGLDKDKSNEDIACLRPRILRDLAFAANPDAPDLTHLEESAKGYSEAYRKTQGSYSGVNASSAHALLGDLPRAQKIAREVSALLAAKDDDAQNAYFHRATLAECRLLEGDLLGAASLYGSAVEADDVTPGKRATSRRQLKRLARRLDIDLAWIDKAAPQPSVLYFSGPIARKIDGNVDAATEALIDALEDLLDHEDIGWAHGALASGADIAIAERLIGAGVSLSVHLPLPPQDFLKSSVHIGGDAWRDRFFACMRAAATIDWARCSPQPCNAVYRLSAETAMGRTVRHAEQLETQALGFFGAAAGPAGDSSMSLSAAARWRARGLKAVEARCDWPGRQAPQRDLRAVEDEVVLFALVAQFADAEARAPFALGRASSGAQRVLEALGGKTICALFHSVETALAACKETLSAKDAGNLRLWLDAGVFTKEKLRDGAMLSEAPLLTATCQPLTDPGAAYASDPFACAAALSPSLASMRFEYVGFVPTQEKLDPCALYQLQG